VATFTFTDYVDTHLSVCGTAFFESRLDSSLTPGQTYTLTYVVNGVTVFQPVITVRPGVGQIGRGTGRKGAFFGDPGDECRTIAPGCLGWYIESRLGPFKTITVTDDGLAGATFECDRLTVTLWSVDASGHLLKSFNPVAAGATIDEITCSPGAFKVVVSNIPANRLLRVLIRATPQVLDSAGGVLFQNAAIVNHVSEDLTVNEDNVAGQRRSSRVGGNASGVNLPTTTTTAAPTTTVASVLPTTPTTIVAALPPTPPTFPVPPGAQLPATGSNNSLFFAGVFMLLAGVSLLVTARRRGDVRPDVG
jgi:LPXTG-motif cell wall-anchored protein